VGEDVEVVGGTDPLDRSAIANLEFGIETIFADHAADSYLAICYGRSLARRTGRGFAQTRAD
jgi:hypothetical protein